MNIGLAIEIDKEAFEKSALIQSFSDRVTEEFRDRDYGEDIERVDIGFICIRTTSGFESFSAKRKPKYVKSQKVSLLNGGSIVVKNTFCYDIKFDNISYEKFLHSSDNASVEMLKDALVESLQSFDLLPKSVTKFDLERFKSDIKKFVRDLGNH